MEVAGVPANLEESAMVAIDKLDKVGQAGVRAELLARGISEEIADRLMSMLQTQSDDNDTRLEWLSEALEASERGLHGLNDLREIVQHTNFTPAGPHLRVTPYLARGLSYYTGAIYEIFVPDFGSSLAAGGRYDNLIGLFSRQAIPACGLSLGLERIMTVMEDRGMFPEDLSTPQVMVSVWTEEVAPQTLQLAAELRRAGLRVDVHPRPDRYGKQFRYAEERRIRYVLLLGEQELASQTVAVKDLKTGDQVSVARSDVVQFLLHKV
jgi:histidyl-tRNA synthetase